ncbi:MAG TPA: gliding motility-associated C-terminal domain-containing protein [Tenuifilaceae bacterium]|nr:gliding motility-associated C-terminal domain-containing protein [Tenuifilaceae bacterium]HPE18607.1 gliding motility-associated C-terminal domain-containing protein [Tenuifilaceae bacterium]HPJ46022.1 gliding motility-associated C-terminal domain-containing protein [Tenuifilaceae bacterium]HPQ34725.1 gliding motility-associated C-terminal domain-containing protein [Tenuifilaceae bacterium]HRX67354.1 gliding motility-associated C-terminal domain-containing protein [Tenuifilaceae bacterium]
MKKGLLSLAIVTVVFSTLFVTNTFSQNFHYELLGVPAPDEFSDSTAFVEFRDILPASATFTKWEINGEDFITNPVTYQFDISNSSEFFVRLIFSNPNPDTLEATINVTAALFLDSLDKELGELASLKRVFRSAFDFHFNHPDSIGSWRFDWTINDEKPVGITFPEPGMGDFPNIYHTFENGGDYNVRLRVTNIDNSTYVAIFNPIIHLEPIFGTDKIDFNPLPNVFSPNNDGVNDFYEVIASGTTKLSFKVFARSGALVYQHEANVIKWDGKNDYNKDVPDGIYYYILEDIGEKRYNPAKGFFYILRGEKN